MQIALQRLLQGLRLAVDEVVHHDDVLPIVIWSRAGVTGRDLDPGDSRVVKHDAEEGQAPIARRGRDETREDPTAVRTEVVDQRAVPSIRSSFWLVNIREDGTEASHRCRGGAISSGYEEQTLGDPAADRGEQAQRAERAEDGAVRRIVEEPCK